MIARADRLLDRILDSIFRVGLRSSGRAAFVLSYGIYLGFGLALPIWQGWQPMWLFYANIASVLVASTIALGWFVARAREANAQHLVEWTTDLALS